MPKKARTRYGYKSAITGKSVTRGYAERNPRTTVGERVKAPSRRKK